MDSNSHKRKICYVYLAPITKKNVYIAFLDPCLVANALKDYANVSVMYSGDIDKTHLQESGLTGYQYCTNRIGPLRHLTLSRYLCLCYNIGKLACKRDVDIFINAWDHYLLLPVIFTAKLFGKPVIARIVGVPIQSHSEKSGSRLKRIKKCLGLQMEKLSLRLCSHIQVISDFLRELYIERGQAPSRFSVISTGVDTNRFCPQSTDRKPTGKRILFVGRLTRIKGADLLLRAFRIVSEALENCECIIVGKGPELRNLRELSASLSLANKVNFREAVPNDELASAYHSADLLAVPSRREGLSKVTLEAFACGTTVVSTDVGALPSLLADDRGMVIPAEDEKLLAEGIITLLSNDKLRQEMAGRAREYVVREHSLEAVRKKYIEMFDTVAQG